MCRGVRHSGRTYERYHIAICDRSRPGAAAHADRSSEHRLHHHRPAALRHGRGARVRARDHAEPRSPRAGGTTFTRTYVTAPSCAPSRASLFTGDVPAHSRGVLKNNDPWSHSWIEQLADTQDCCVNVGKMHTYPYTESVGFHERHVVENKDRSNPTLPFFLDEWDKAFRSRAGQARQGDEVPRSPGLPRAAGRVRVGGARRPPRGQLRRRARRTLAGRVPRRTAFFLQIGFPGPHPPYDPTHEALERYEGVAMPEAHDSAEDRASQPFAVKDLIRDNLRGRPRRDRPPRESDGRAGRAAASLLHGERDDDRCAGGGGRRCP